MFFFSQNVFYLSDFQWQRKRTFSNQLNSYNFLFIFYVGYYWYLNSDWASIKVADRLTFVKKLKINQMIKNTIKSIPVEHFEASFAFNHFLVVQYSHELLAAIFQTLHISLCQFHPPGLRVKVTAPVCAVKKSGVSFK